jgi:hypothetical protein
MHMSRAHCIGGMICCTMQWSKDTLGTKRENSGLIRHLFIIIRYVKISRGITLPLPGIEPWSSRTQPVTVLIDLSQLWSNRCHMLTQTWNFIIAWSIGRLFYFWLCTSLYFCIYIISLSLLSTQILCHLSCMCKEVCSLIQVRVTGAVVILHSTVTQYVFTVAIIWCHTAAC